MRRLANATLALVFVLALTASESEAQTALTGAVGMFGFSGDEWSDVNVGLGAEAAIEHRFDGPVSLGGVFHWSVHTYDGPTSLEFPGVADESINSIGLFIQPLYHLGAPGQTDVFFGLRGGYLSVGDIENATGFLGGPVAGIAFPIGPRVSAGFGGTWSALSLSRPETATGTDRIGGSSWGAGAFLTVGFGGS